MPPLLLSETILNVAELVAGYGVTRVLHGVSFTIRAGQIVTLIGANGAGKTTTLRSLLGLTKVHTGSIVFFGEELVGRPSYRIAQRGLGFVPQERNIFPTLSVRENLEMGGYLLKPAELGTRIEYVTNFLPVLKDRIHQQAGTLSGGERRMLAIGRALIAKPRLLMLDEPSLGLAPKVVDAVFERVNAIHEDGVGILIVEQNARRALGIADHGYVLELGHVRFEGSGRNLLEDPNVQKAYLGG
jgi:ABC-type branched-subunit amino acid transport system ATPase component